MDMKTNKETEVTLTQERVLSIEVSSRITKEKKQMPSIFLVTSLSSLATDGMELDEDSGFPADAGKAPLTLLLRTWPPTCLYDPLVPGD